MVSTTTILDSFTGIFEQAVDDLDDTALAAFTRLAFRYLKRGQGFADDDRLARVAGVSLKRWQRVRATLADLGFEHRAGWCVHRDLDGLLTRQRQASLRAKRNGIRGAQKRVAETQALRQRNFDFSNTCPEPQLSHGVTPACADKTKNQDSENKKMDPLPASGASADAVAFGLTPELHEWACRHVPEGIDITGEVELLRAHHRRSGREPRTQQTFDDAVRAWLTAPITLQRWALQRRLTRRAADRRHGVTNRRQAEPDVGTEWVHFPNGARALMCRRTRVALQIIDPDGTVREQSAGTQTGSAH